MNSYRHSNKNPPWCSAGKPARNKPREIRPQFFVTHSLSENCDEDTEILYIDNSAKNSSCAGRPRKRINSKKNVFLWLFFVIIMGLIAPLLVTWNGSKWAGVENFSFNFLNVISKWTDEECCYKMKQISNDLRRAKHLLRMSRLDVTRKSNFGAKEPHLTQPIFGAIASKGEDTKIWSSRAALWGIVPLWRTSPPVQIVLEMTKVAPGDCWPFSGNTGELIVHLPSHIQLRSMSLEHIRPDAAKSAPKHFSLYAILENGTRINSFNSEYKYEGPAKQLYNLPTFPVADKVAFRVMTNQGNTRYTCIYRVLFYT